MRKNKTMRPRFFGLMVIGIALWVGLSALGTGSWFTLPVQAQADTPEAIALQAYEQLPWLSKENQYQRQDNGKIAEESTLMSRLIRYHTQNKTRSPFFRLDWKLTLANYLGLDDYIQAETYPGASYLNPNPMESDRKIIQGLNRKQRDALVQAIVDIYDPAEGSKASAPNVSPTGGATPTTGTPATGTPATGTPATVTPQSPSEKASDLLAPQPPTEEKELPKGDAQLLLP
jgi:hypothetical protein